MDTKTYLFVSAAFFAAMATNARAVQALSPTPLPGEVFREYSWTPTGKYNVLEFKQSALPYLEREAAA